MKGEQLRDAQGRYAAAAEAAAAATAKAEKISERNTPGVAAKAHDEAAVLHHLASKAAISGAGVKEQIMHRDARSEHGDMANKLRDTLSVKSQRSQGVSTKSVSALSKFAEKHAGSAPPKTDKDFK